MSAGRTWNDGKRCDECCTGDRCDDPTHVSRENCRHCFGTSWAIWTEAGRADFAKSYRMTDEEARAAIATATGSTPTDDVVVRCIFCHSNIHGADAGPPCETREQATRCDAAMWQFEDVRTVNGQDL